jgi:hypothetical protein
LLRVIVLIPRIGSRIGRVARRSGSLITLALIAVALSVGACYTGPGIDHFAAVLNELAVPADWELVRTETRGSDGDFVCDPIVVSNCPAVTRTYVVDADPRAALNQAEGFVEAAGFELAQELIPDCEGTPSGPACSVFSSRNNDRVLVSVFRSTSDAGIKDAPIEGTTVQVVATGPK